MWWQTYIIWNNLHFQLAEGIASKSAKTARNPDYQSTLIMECVNGPKEVCEDWSFMSLQNIVPVVSPGVVQDSPSSSVLDRVSSPSIPYFRPIVVGCKQICLHQIKLAFRFRRTKDRRQVVWTALRMLYRLRCTGRLCLL